MANMKISQLEELAATPDNAIGGLNRTGLRPKSSTSILQQKGIQSA